MSKSPSQRTLEYLREQGWPNVQLVERWIPQARRRKDLFRFADILAMHPIRGHLYVQATTGSHVNARLEKMLVFAEDEIEDALACGARVEIHGWRKLTGKGRRQWFPLIKDVTLEVLHDMTEEQWRFVMQQIREMWQDMPEKALRKGDMGAYVSLHDYPPGIQILVHLTGATQKEVPEFTSAEKRLASELAETLAKPIMDRYDFMALKKARHVDRWQLGYMLRPQVYSEFPGVKNV